jgi:magnesium transporter
MTGKIHHFVEEVTHLLEHEDMEGLQEFLNSLHPSDIAETIDYTEDREKQLLIFTSVDHELGSKVLAELGDHSRTVILESLTPTELSPYIETLPSDVATDLLSEIPPEQTEQILEQIPDEDSREVKKLLRYSDESAGGVMGTEYISVTEETTVQETIDCIREQAGEIFQLSNVYVVDREEHLTGKIPLVKLLVVDPASMVQEIMETDVIRVSVYADQEVAAQIMARYNLINLPVVDHEEKLTGIITIDDVMDIMETETTEDITRMAGTSEEEFHQTSVPKIAKIRLPWLAIALLEGLLATLVLRHFEGTFQSFLALVLFIPIIMAMGGNCGLQSSTITIRSIVLGEFELLRLWKRLFIELRVGLLMGVFLGAFLAFFAVVWEGSPLLGVIVGISLICVVTASVTFGAFIPLILHRLKIDPAVATGPFLTTTNDIFGLVIYFTLASLLLRYFL